MGKNLQTRLLHTGDGQFYKRANKSSSVPEVLPVYRTSVFAFDELVRRSIALILATSSFDSNGFII